MAIISHSDRQLLGNKSSFTLCSIHRHSCLLSPSPSQTRAQGAHWRFEVLSKEEGVPLGDLVRITGLTALPKRSFILSFKISA